jgi:hypothetical protein
MEMEKVGSTFIILSVVFIVEQGVQKYRESELIDVKVRRKQTDASERSSSCYVQSSRHMTPPFAPAPTPSTPRAPGGPPAAPAPTPWKASLASRFTRFDSTVASVSSDTAARGRAVAPPPPPPAFFSSSTTSFLSMTRRICS